MNISIKRRIYYGFTLLVFLFMLGGLVTTLTLSSHNKSSAYISEVIEPSIRSLSELNIMLIESKMYATNWVHLSKNQSDKEALIQLQTQRYVTLKAGLNTLSAHWVERRWVDSLHHLFVAFDRIAEQEQRIMHLLKTQQDYTNTQAKREAEQIVYNEVIPLTAGALTSLKGIINAGHSKQLQQTNKLEHTSSRLYKMLIILGITFVGLGLFLSIYFVRVVLLPIKKIRHIVNNLGRGKIYFLNHKNGRDEIAQMIQSINSLSASLQRTATFAHEVGERNFDITFEPLSEEDTLGKALIAMRDNLKNSENNLLAANSELNMLFNSIDEVFFSVDMINLKVIQVSNACEKLYWHAKEDILNDHLFWVNLIHPEDRPIINKETDKLQHGEVVTNQYRIIRKDDTVRWVESKISPTLDKSGNLIRVDGITRDVTERKKAEAELLKSEDRYRQIVETAQEGIWMIDEENKTVFVNKKMCDILGYTQQEMIGKTNLFFKDEEGRKASLQQIEKRKQGVNESHDSTFVSKDGRLIHVHVSTNPIVDDEGKYKGALAMMTDITQRKLDEEALKKSEANLKTVFNNSDVAYVLIDSNVKVVAFNELAQKFATGYYTKSLQEGTDFISCFPQDRHSFMHGVLEKVCSGEKMTYEMNLQHNGGAEKWYEIQWAGIVNKEMRNFGYLITSKNITEKKFARLEREKVTSDLIQRNKDLQQFTYIVSHNLRAPVANIMGISNLLNLSSPALSETENAGLLNGLTSSVKQLDNIILDLNEILKVRNPGSELKEKVCFSSLVVDIKSSINHIVAKENVVINFNFEEADHAFTLKTYLYSIFYNLIINSIKYKQPHLAPLIEIKGYRCDKKVHLVFRDNGKGIDMEKNGADIFMLYKRFDTSVEGKGLGLYMVKTAVETLGGSISLKSAVNKGAEFKIELPFLN